MTFSRMSLALAVHMKGLGFLLWRVDVFADGHDELFEILEDAAPDAVLGQVAEEAFDHVEP